MRRLRFAVCLVGAVLSATFGLAAPAGAAEPGLTVSGLRQEAGLLEFYLSAHDLAAGVGLDDVSVTAGDRSLTASAQPISVNGGTGAPRRAVMLVLDTSGSMTGAAITAARAAAQRYVDQLPPDVEIGVVSAGAPAVVVVAPSKDRAAVSKAVAGLAAKGETALYDGVRAAAELISTGEWGQRRIVALSDGADTASKANLATVKQAANTAKIPVDTIAFRTQDNTVNILAELAASTGGRAYAAADASALSTAFASAAGSFTALLLVRVTVPAEMSGQQARLKISAGGAATDLQVDLAVDTKAVKPLVGVPAPGPGSTWLLVTGGLVFAGLLTAMLLLVSPTFSAAARRRRLAQVEQFTAAPKRGRSMSEGSSQVTQAALAFSAQLVKSTNAEGRIAQQLDRAGMRLRPHEWLLLRALVCFVLAVLVSLMVTLPAGLLLGPLLGWALTSLYHRRRADKRSSAFADLLPDALQLITGSLRSGFALAQSIDSMARELPDPISTEFGRALGETRLGVDIEDALDRLAVRMRSKELAWAVVAMRVQRDAGGNLAEVLTTTVESMRERDTLRREVRSLSAEGRLSAWVLLALPIGVAGLMVAFRREYIEPLYTEPLGIAMSVVAVLLVLVGGFWLSRMVKIEV